VRHTRERFLELAAGRWSAWSVAEVWLARDPVTCKGKDEDFVGLAACELWKRWLSDRPSLEMLNDWMQDGYDFMERGLGVEAVEKWWQVWRTLQPRFEPGMTTMDKTRPLYEGTQSLFNWSQDLSMELLNAALEDAEWARRGVQFHREWIAQFPDEDDRMQANFHRDLAECLIRSGDAAAGLTVFHEVVERWPDDVWGYVALADACSDGSLPVDLDQARKWIATARARLPAGTRDLYVLDVREAYIQERASRAAT